MDREREIALTERLRADAARGELELSLAASVLSHEHDGEVERDRGLEVARAGAARAIERAKEERFGLGNPAFAARDRAERVQRTRDAREVPVRFARVERLFDGPLVPGLARRRSVRPMPSFDAATPRPSSSF